MCRADVSSSLAAVLGAPLEVQCFPFGGAGQKQVPAASSLSRSSLNPVLLSESCS